MDNSNVLYLFLSFEIFFEFGMLEQNNNYCNMPKMELQKLNTSA
jgi:hypothetical protein